MAKSIDAKVAAYRDGLLKSPNPPSGQSLAAMVVGYRNSLVREAMEGRPSARAGSSAPPPPDVDAAPITRRTERLAEVARRLAAVQARIATADVLRMRRLLQVAKLQMDAGNINGLHSVALELGHVARVTLVGLDAVHAIAATPRALPAPPDYDDGQLISAATSAHVAGA